MSDVASLLQGPHDTHHLHTGHSGDSVQPLIEDTQSALSDYSTTVIRQPQGNNLPPLSSVLTIRPTENGNNGAGDDILRRNATSAFSMETFQTAHSSISTTAATEGGSTIRSIPSALVHRFTLLKPGTKRSSGSISPQRSPPGEGGWNPFELIFTSGLLTSKCDVCTKRIGWKTVLECDDCGLR